MQGIALAIEVIVSIKSGWWMRNVEGDLNVISITESSRFGEITLMMSPSCQAIVLQELVMNRLASFDVGVNPSFLEMNHTSSARWCSHNKSLLVSFVANFKA